MVREKAASMAAASSTEANGMKSNGAKTTGANIAVTGVSGFLGQRLLPMLDAHDGVERIVGLDVRDPARRSRKLEFHRVDVGGADLAPFFRGVTTIVHLAAIVGPIPDASLFTHVNIESTRRVLDGAAAASVRKVVRPSSAAVYGAWANNPIPLTEESPLRPSPGYLPAIVDAECERLVVEWAAERDGRVGTRLRLAPVVGPGQSLFAEIATGRSFVRVRGASPPVQVLHVDDAASALALAVEQDLDGVFNVAADGWLTSGDAEALLTKGRLPALPAELAQRILATTWAMGMGDAPPSVLPYLVHPWVVANDRIVQSGWRPKHSNDEAILLATPARGTSIVPYVAGAAALSAGVALGTWWLRRRRRVR
jgi:nucleoside-diphosphate-sugar epimerase